MDICKAGLLAYGVNGNYLGRLDSDGHVRKEGVVTFRVSDRSVYSMHGQWLGDLVDGVVRYRDGTIIFALLDE